MIKETETVIKKITKRTQLTLPSEVAEAFKSLPMLERKAYCQALVSKGWTYQSIGTALGLSRESIRLYTKTSISEVVSNKVSQLPMPELPYKEVSYERVKRVPIEPDVLAQLKELHAKASQVRGRGKNYRKEAELFTKLAWEQTQKGVSAYAIAKALGITHGALLFRFVRYGYKTTNGKSRVFRQLTHRAKEGQ